MPFSKVALTSASWTLIGNNVAKITFQNAGQYPIYIASSATNSAPADTVGLIYAPFMGESQSTIADLTPNGGAYIWARAAASKGSIIVHT